MQHMSIVDFCLDVYETHSWLQMCRKYDRKHVLDVTTVSQKLPKSKLYICYTI